MVEAGPNITISYVRLFKAIYSSLVLKLMAISLLKPLYHSIITFSNFLYGELDRWSVERPKYCTLVGFKLKSKMAVENLIIEDFRYYL